MCSPDCPCGGNLPRRAFISRGALGTIGAFVLSACGDRNIGGTYPTDPFPTTPFTIKLSDFPQLAPIGGMARLDGGTGQPVALVRTGTASFEAVSLVCPHQGAIVELAGSPAFRCPSHLAEFAADGTWIGGHQTGDLTQLGVTFDPNAGTVTINGPVGAGPAPSMSVSPTSEVFAAVQNGTNPAVQTASITNTGGGTLSGLDIVVGYGLAQPSGWLAATLDVHTAPATLTLQPSIAGLAPGAYTATVQITAPTAVNAPQALPVSLLVSSTAAAPTIAVASTNVAFAAAAGSASPVAQQLAITNVGGGTLAGLSIGTIAFGAGAAGWLERDTHLGHRTLYTHPHANARRAERGNIYGDGSDRRVRSDQLAAASCRHLHGGRGECSTQLGAFGDHGVIPDDARGRQHRNPNDQCARRRRQHHRRAHRGNRVWHGRLGVADGRALHHDSAGDSHTHRLSTGAAAWYLYGDGVGGICRRRQFAADCRRDAHSRGQFRAGAVAGERVIQRARRHEPGRTGGEHHE